MSPRGLLLAATVWLVPATAGADLVYLTTGRTLSVRTHRFEGSRVVLSLRAGGELECDASLIVRVGPDEVPWDEPRADAPPAEADRPPISGDAVSLDALIEPLARQHAVDVDLIRAVVAAESNYSPTARSAKGAMGLMQLMPSVARQYGVANPYDPHTNLDAGIRHLRLLLTRYEVPLALAAYNAGETAVRRHGGIPPFRETRDYVARILARWQAAGAVQRP